MMRKGNASGVREEDALSAKFNPTEILKQLRGAQSQPKFEPAPAFHANGSTNGVEPPSKDWMSMLTELGALRDALHEAEKRAVVLEAEKQELRMNYNNALEEIQKLEKRCASLQEQKTDLLKEISGVNTLHKKIMELEANVEQLKLYNPRDASDLEPQSPPSKRVDTPSRARKKTNSRETKVLTIDLAAEIPPSTRTQTIKVAPVSITQLLKAPHL